MRIKYAMVAALLAGGLLAAPAMAGVTDTTGGDKTTSGSDKDFVQTQKHYQTVEGVTTRSSSTSVSGHSYYKNVYQNANTLSEVSSRSAYVNADSAVASRKASITNSLKNDLVVSGRTAVGQPYVGSTTQSSVDTKTVTYTAYEKTAEKLVHDSDDSVQTFTYTNGSIAIGDPDSLANMYVAAGGVNVDTAVTHNYTNHETWTNKKNTHIHTTTYYQVNVMQNVSPIVLDLDGNGTIEASNGNYKPHAEMGFNTAKATMFDFHGNGFPVLTEWVGANDGLLVRTNDKGTVNGTNLFGTLNGFANGYNEMASLDVNNSGALEGAELNGLAVWTDVNGNAVAEASEIHSLDSLGITSISVNHNELKSTFVRNGQTYNSFDWWPNVVEVRKVDMAKR